MDQVTHVDQNVTGAKDPARIRTLVVGPDPTWQKTTSELLERYPELEVVALIKNHQDAIPLLTQRGIDLLWMDLADQEGKSLQLLKRLDEPPMTVVTTDRSAHAVDAFEIGVTDLLLRPFSVERGQLAVHRVIERSRKGAPAVEAPSEAMIAVRSGRRSMLLPVSSVLLVEATGNDVLIHLQDRQLEAKCSMKAMGSMLPGDRFSRVHRSFIVAHKIVKDVHQDTLFTTLGEIPIGTAFRKKIGAILTHLIGSA